MPSVRLTHWVLVCGGRDYTNQNAAFSTLDTILARCPAMGLIHGGARGADSLAGAWATSREVFAISLPAPWEHFKSHGLPEKTAGRIRNLMLRELLLSFPGTRFGVSFPGGSGTKHMVSLLKEVRIPVIEVVDGS